MCVYTHTYVLWTSGFAHVGVGGGLLSTYPTAWELLVSVCPHSSLQAWPGLLFSFPARAQGPTLGVSYPAPKAQAWPYRKWPDD